MAFSSPEYGTFTCIENMFKQIPFLLSDSLNGTLEQASCLLFGRGCFSVSLPFFKSNLFLKSDHPFPALNPSGLVPIPFCFKLSYNDSAFSHIIEFIDIGIPFLQWSSAHIKSAFSILDEKAQHSEQSTRFLCMLV